MTEKTENNQGERDRQESNLGEWNDIKIFRDPVHQYIEIPKAYVRYLIDTYEMQRIKDVAQSGLRSVYNAATHDRFSHSMGVYHLGKKAFRSLEKNVRNIMEKENFRYRSGEERLIVRILVSDSEDEEKIREERKAKAPGETVGEERAAKAPGETVGEERAAKASGETVGEERKAKAPGETVGEERKAKAPGETVGEEERAQNEEKIWKELKLWEVLFHTACILHDIGHPAMSHTLEFLYDDIYADIGCDESGEENADLPATISLEEYKRFLTLRREYVSAVGEAPARFKMSLSKKLLGVESEKINGNPHERMSAYYILAGVELKDGECVGFTEGSLAENIVKLVNSFRKSKNMGAASKEECLEYLRFICRMIIGEPYQIPQDEKRAKERILNSVKNAVIALLNGKIDADSLDYIARNSYSAGYDTNNIDVNRMCNAYSVRFENNQFVSVFEKNALSVLEGFVNARNFEPSWLYSHHKIVYNIDVLYKHLYKCAVQILYRNDLQAWSKLLMENFYGYEEPFREGGNFEDAGPVEKLLERKLSGNEINALSNQLADLYVDSKESVYEKLLKLMDDADEKIANGARLLWKKIKENGAASYRDKEEWNEKGTLWVGEVQQLRDMLDGLWKYMETKCEIDNAFIVILEKNEEDILDSPLKELMVRTRRYLALLARGDEKRWGEVEKKKEEFYGFLKALSQRYCELEDMVNLYFSYILSPVRCFRNEKFLFYRSNDSDIDALFKRLYFGLTEDERQGRGLSEAERRYLGLAREYFERKYKSSLWKSYQEYKIFIDEIADNVGMDASKVNHCFLELIRKGGKRIDFQSDGNKNGGMEEQRVFEYNGPETRWSAQEKTGKAESWKAESEKAESWGAESWKSEPEKAESERKDSDVMKFQEVFSVLRDTGFVIRIHTVKYKDFGKSIKIAFKEKVFLLGEVIDLPDTCSKDYPYIFLNLAETEGETKGEARRRHMERLRKKLEEYCAGMLQAKLIVKKEDAGDIMTGGKVFRDVVHGDIRVPKEFMGLIETGAFQRLRRIKQLSTADMVFPNAVHTRFAHCIGTFHVMRLIVEHFKDVFNMLGVPYEKEDVDALLAAALLHDIGHGPYSHNFERIAGNVKKHENWGAEIIREDPEIRSALKTGFSEYDLEEFIEKITFYIMEDTKKVDDKKLSFQTIFKSLMSSQLDADRLDYLLRDSFNTGIGYGKIDVGAIIRGMQVTEYRNRFYVCIAENAVSYIEQFLFGRYKMYDSVYYNAYKVFSETLVLKILEYVKKNTKKTGVPVDSTMMALFNGGLSLEGYLALDDSHINGLFGSWQGATDPVLSGMCRALLQRKGYKRLYIMNQGAMDIYNFKQALAEIFNQYFPELKLDPESMNSFIFAERRFSAYRYVPMEETDRGNGVSKIWVLTNDGLLKDFAEISFMFSADSQKTWETYKSVVYYNMELLGAELESMKGFAGQETEGAEEDYAKKFTNRKKMLLEDIKQLIKNSNLRNHIEIEEKYSCRLGELEAVKQMLDAPEDELKKRYVISSEKKIKQVDTYYDTEDLRIAGKKCSFRCRRKSDQSYKITIKAPAPNSGFDKESQVARFEYEREISSGNLEDAFDFIRNTLKRDFPDLAAGLTRENINQVFKPKLQVENDRSKYLISNPKEDKGGFQFTVCLDRVKFVHEKEERQDYQIEVELESDYIHRVSMKFFTEEIEEKLEKPVRHEQFSKYVKGLEALGLYRPET